MSDNIYTSAEEKDWERPGVRQVIGIVLAVLILAGMHLVPVTEELPYAARNTLIQFAQ